MVREDCAWGHARVLIEGRLPSCFVSNVLSLVGGFGGLTVVRLMDRRQTSVVTSCLVMMKQIGTLRLAYETRKMCAEGVKRLPIDAVVQFEMTWVVWISDFGLPRCELEDLDTKRNDAQAEHSG
ncbi:hypothetical protein Efla_001369 [Eimeria flavescens]